MSQLFQQPQWSCLRRYVGQRVNLCIRSPTISRPSAEPFNSTARTDNSIRRIPGAP